MATRRIGLEIGRSYALTVGTDQTIVTALASPWAEDRIAELEAALLEIARPTYGTEPLSSDEERADVFCRHMQRFQTIARKVVPNWAQK